MHKLNVRTWKGKVGSEGGRKGKAFTISREQVLGRIAIEDVIILYDQAKASVSPRKQDVFSKHFR